MSKKPLIQLNDICKSFTIRQERGMGRKKTIHAVQGVNLSITAGENLALVGESGSGKTTLGRMMVHLYRPDRGAVIIDGVDTARAGGGKARAAQRIVQMVFQDPYSSLDPRWRVRGILSEGLRQYGPRLKAPAEEARLIGILRRVSLPQDALNRYPHEFSGGERQRVAIARALLMNPRLLILDEAVSALDVLIQAQIIELLKEIQKIYPMTYLFISHNLRVVRKICQRIAVMYQGRIVEEANTRDLFENPLHPYTRSLLAAAVDYRPAEGPAIFDIPENSCLIDKGNRHFVID